MEPNKIHDCVHICVTIPILYLEFEIFINYLEPPVHILFKIQKQSKHKLHHKQEGSQNREIIQTDDIAMKIVRRRPVEPLNELSWLMFQFHYRLIA